MGTVDRIFNDLGSLEKAEILEKVTPFNILNINQLNLLAEAATCKKYPKNTYVYRQNEPSKNTLYIIVSGRARITVSSDEGQTTMLGYREPYDFIGVTALDSGEEYPASVLADEDLTCLLIPRDILEVVMNRDAVFATSFSLEVRRRLRNLYKSLSGEKINTIVKEEEFKESLSLRKKVAEIMTSPAVTCSCMDSVGDIAQTMSDRGVSSVIVVSSNNKPLGIITEKDLVKRVLSTKDPAALEKKAHQIMSPHLITIHSDEFSYQALLLMAKHTIKHIVVIENGDPTGILTMRDLIRSRQTGALSTVNKIELEKTLEGLSRTVHDIDHVLQALVMERAYASEIGILIAEFYDRLNRKVIQLAEEEMISEGYGKPPTPYSWINMGSSGRMEQFARSDQDNGIIFEEPDEKDDLENVCQYFLTLGEKVVSGLEKCGFKRCEGLVMASNPQWCRSINEWKKVVKGWVNALEPENVRNITIFLDFRHIYGDAELAQKLRDHVCELFKKSYPALWFLVEDVLRRKAPLNIFRSIVTERAGPYRNHVNLKSNACVFIVDCIRAFSLREGIKATSTFERLKQLKPRGVLTKDECEAVETAYETLMMFRIRRAVSLISQGYEPDNYINPYKLSRKEKSQLKDSLLTVNKLQNLTAQTFRLIT